MKKKDNFTLLIQSLLKIKNVKSRDLIFYLLILYLIILIF